MKIAMFTNTYAPTVGGIEKSVETFSEDLRSLGHQVLVVTVRQTSDDPEEPGVLRLPAVTGIGKAAWSWKLPGGGIDGALDAFAPDIIHAHQPFMLGSSAFRQAALRKVPLVFTNHTLYERYADRSFLGELEALERAARALTVVYSNRCDAVIAPTESIADILRTQGVEPEIDIVPTGIDTERFSGGDGAGFRQAHGIPGDAFVMGHLGRLIPAKRIAFLAEATARFLTEHPKAVALFCGEGESVVTIRQTFANAGVDDRLVLVGILPEGVIADAYAAMDVFTFASLTDTQGIVLLEAMAAGLPVLALRATGPQDLVLDGVCGRLLDPEAGPESFAAAITDFLMRPDLTSFNEAARRRASEFHRRLCAGRLLDVYERTLRSIPHREFAAASPGGVLEDLQHRVEVEWRLIAGRAEELRALLPTRGFPRSREPCD